MKIRRPVIGLAILMLLVGCTQPAPPSQHQQAFYQNKPISLFDGLSKYCVRPSQRLERLSATHIRCHQFLDPETTAGLILAHSGSIKDLPTLIGSISMAPGHLAGETGFMVTFVTFIKVPQANGPALKVFHRTPAIRRAFRIMLRTTGGIEIRRPS